MGILTDAFIATDAELLALYPGEGGPAALFPTVQAKRVDEVKLATLEAIVTQRAPDRRSWNLDKHLIRDWDEEFILRVPQSLVSALAQLQSSEITPVATAWAATEEWQLDGIASVAGEKVEDLARLVGALCQLAQRAEREGKSMYMWMSL